MLYVLAGPHSEIVKLLYVLAGPHSENPEIVLCPSRTSHALTWQLTLLMFSLHGSSLCSCFSLCELNENVDDPGRDLKIQNALAGQPSQGLKDKMP